MDVALICLGAVAGFVVHALLARVLSRRRPTLRAELVGVADPAVDRSAYWEKRFWSLSESIQQVLSERDGWQQKYDDAALKWLEGQNILAQNVAKAETLLKQAVRMLNAERAARRKVLEEFESGAKPDLKVLAGPAEPVTRLRMDESSLQHIEAYHETIRAISRTAKAEHEQTRKALADKRATWEQHFEALIAEAEKNAPAPIIEPASEAGIMVV